MTMPALPRRRLDTAVQTQGAYSADQSRDERVPTADAPSPAWHPGQRLLSCGDAGLAVTGSLGTHVAPKLSSLGAALPGLQAQGRSPGDAGRPGILAGGQPALRGQRSVPPGPASRRALDFGRHIPGRGKGPPHPPQTTDNLPPAGAGGSRLQAPLTCRSQTRRPVQRNGGGT